MKFSLVTLHVKDMETSLNFYRDLLNMPLLRRQETPHGELAFLGEKDGVQLELIASPENAEVPYEGFSIGFDVADMEQSAEMLKAKGFPLTKGPFSPGPSTTLAFLKGPDGEEVELIQYR